MNNARLAHPAVAAGCGVFLASSGLIPGWVVAALIGAAIGHVLARWAFGVRR